MLHVCSHVISKNYFSVLFQKHLLSCRLLLLIIIFSCVSLEEQSN